MRACMGGMCAHTPQEHRCFALRARAATVRPVWQPHAAQQGGAGLRLALCSPLQPSAALCSPRCVPSARPLRPLRPLHPLHPAHPLHPLHPLLAHSPHDKHHALSSRNTWVCLARFAPPPSLSSPPLALARSVRSLPPLSLPPATSPPPPPTSPTLARPGRCHLLQGVGGRAGGAAAGMHTHAHL